MISNLQISTQRRWVVGTVPLVIIGDDMGVLNEESVDVDEDPSDDDSEMSSISSCMVSVWALRVG